MARTMLPGPLLHLMPMFGPSRLGIDSGARGQLGELPRNFQNFFDDRARLCFTPASANGPFTHIGPHDSRFPPATEPLLTSVWLPMCR